MTYYLGIYICLSLDTRDGNSHCRTGCAFLSILGNKAVKKYLRVIVWQELWNRPHGMHHARLRKLTDSFQQQHFANIWAGNQRRKWFECSAKHCLISYVVSSSCVDYVKMPPPWFIMHYWCHSTKSFNTAVVFFSTKKTIKSKARRPSGLKQMPCNRNELSLNVVGGCCCISTPYSYFLSPFYCFN